MNYAALIAIGAIGWLLLIVRSTIRGCIAGHAPLALLSCLILSILVIDVWAIAPFQMEGRFARSVTLWLLWPAAVFPYVALLYRLFRNPERSRTSLESKI
jgi:hypothetical protein